VSHQGDIKNLNQIKMTASLQKLCFLAGVLLLMAGSASAQHEAMFSQYMFNGLILNPAYAGSTEVLTANALYRKQWLQVEGAPTTQTFSLSAPVNHKKIGLGATIVNDKIGNTRNVGANLAYSYRIKLNKGTLAMGMQTGFNQYYADYAPLKTNPFNNQDQALTEVHNFLVFNFGSGLYYNTDNFYAGISVPNSFRARVAGWGQASGSGPKDSRHCFITTGYVFKLNDELTVKPSTLVKVAQGAPLQIDLNTNVWFYNLVGVGVSYRTSNTVVAMAEVQLSRQFRFGYAYDHGATRIGGLPMNSHEVMIRYDLVSPHTKIISPRFY
jgi:type IX secretion system PorP/SprF family membrane protein